MNQPRNAGCPRVRSRLELLLDGALPPLEQALDRGHLEACAACAQEAESWKRVWRGIRELSRPESDELALATAAAVAELRRPAQQSQRASRGLRIPLALVAAAAAILALLALELSGTGLSAAPEVKDLTAFEQALGRLPSWAGLVRGLESLSRRLS